MPIPKTRPELTELVTTAYAKLQAELDAAGPDVADLPCVDEWSVKDLLAVRLWWTEHVLEWIEAGLRGEVPTTPAPGYRWKETPRLNADIVEAARGSSYRSIRRQLQRGFERVLTTIDALDDGQLLSVGAFEWAGSYPIARWISLNTARQYTTARSYVRRALRAASSRSELMSSTAMRRKVAVFDMGSVLIGWEVRPPFRPHFGSEEELDAFLAGPFREIYDAVHDGEGSMAECLEPMRMRHPQASHLIDIYERKWATFVTGVMEETVEIVRELHARGVELYGLTNWPAQVWPPQSLIPEQAESFSFLDLFSDVWVSGEHKLRKPDPESYRSALRRFGVEAEEAVFVDDLPANVAAAEVLGLTGIHFQDAESLRRDLKRLGLL